MTLTDLHEPLQPLGNAAPIDLQVEKAERQVRLAQQVAAVRRRSRMIAFLRKALPGSIILLGLLNVGWIAAQTIINSMNVYSAATSEVRMTNPRYYGQGSSGDHFTISGLEAIRKSQNATTIQLKAPYMEFKNGDNERPTRISAANGVYDQTNNTFTLNGHVVMEAGGSDFVVKTEQAIVNLENSTVYGDKHVEGTGSVGHIEGESFIISNDGRVVDFKGKGETKVWAQIQ
ncbi:hypothetical protein MMA231_00094 [Asticcacaulis sp. MM231]|uniref:LPS export ABC transporter periplasmic protein LptC n=1 Tax=Asticcacaulis sp. MM231 TaxID=3157666 RepID=UPI0032D58372